MAGILLCYHSFRQFASVNLAPLMGSSFEILDRVDCDFRAAFFAYSISSARCHIRIKLRACGAVQSSDRLVNGHALAVAAVRDIASNESMIEMILEPKGISSPASRGYPFPSIRS